MFFHEILPKGWKCVYMYYYVPGLCFQAFGFRFKGFLGSTGFTFFKCFSGSIGFIGSTSGFPEGLFELVTGSQVANYDVTV